MTRITVSMLVMQIRDLKEQSVYSGVGYVPWGARIAMLESELLRLAEGGEDYDQRVCRSQPICKCIEATSADELTAYECNCIRDGVCCRVCGVKLVSVEHYERMMAKRKHTRTKVAQ